ncbi:MAG: hypothetical protein EXR79_06005 [Myxococcales bacterium]|nr:hypothetical protein [Myxococcales bacterium]
MLDHLKDIAARQVGRVLASEATLKVLSSSHLKTAFVTAINLRAEARDVVEQRVRDVAARLDLATSDQVATLRRTVRDLEDRVQDLGEALAAAEADARQARVQPAGPQAAAVSGAAQGVATADPEPAKGKGGRKRGAASASAI